VTIVVPRRAPAIARPLVQALDTAPSPGLSVWAAAETV